MRVAARNKSALIIFCVLAGWIFWLRWPYFSRPAWNLDEGIHATIARSILDGGVMYRDAIDQRTPLTYYLVAGFFWVFGENNMWAVHALLAGMVAATALGIFLIGRQWRNSATGWWAALIFAAFSTNLFYIGDIHSLSTEWFVILFTSWSTWWFWRTWEQKSFWKAAIGGIGFAAAFLSKQPGLLDFGAPLATLVYAAATGRLRRSEAASQLAGLCAGFVALSGLVFAYFWAKGALGDMYFYAWTYNLLYYGPETTSIDRLLAAGEGIRIIWRNYPVICVALAAGALAVVVRLVQKRPTPGERTDNPAAFYGLTWALLSWAAASSAGRMYDHYYLQLLPAFTLLAGWLLADCQSQWRTGRNTLVKVAAGIALAAAAWSVVAGPLRGPSPPTLTPDSGLATATYVRAHSNARDKLFVWGYSPDIYLYADRRAASRYIYCSFITGMIPWTNTQPERDTSYAIVPGAMEILLGDLEANRPEFIIDTSLTEYRRFTKYPLTKFPRLAAFVSANYLEVEPEQFRSKGFRVLMLKDAARRTPRPLTGGAPDGKLGEPSLNGPLTTDPVTVEYEVQATHPAGKLQRLELLVDGAPADSLTFDPATAFGVRFAVHFERLGRGRHQLMVRATSSSGESRAGPALTVECSPESLPAEQRAAFALPVATPGFPPERVISSFGAMARLEAGALVFFAHAPSVLTYAVPPGAGRLRGRFGFRPGAYAPDNPSRTDGAEFVVTLVNAGGQRTELFRRWLRPWDEPADRGEHSLDVAWPATPGGSRLELAITSGPANNSASDWTYWSDLLLSTSR